MQKINDRKEMKNKGMMSADVFGELCKEKTEEEIKNIKAYLLALGLAVETRRKGQIFIPCLASDLNEVWIFSYSSFII